jgi:protein phosphatase
LVSLIAWAKSDIGRKRAHNEDYYFQSTSDSVFIIADGMGGHKGGDKASKLAVESAAMEFLARKKDSENPGQALSQAINIAASVVYETGRADPRLSGMGTTLSALAIDDGRAYISHIGDTRIYCLREKILHQLTSDHSLVNEQVQAGIMSSEEARTSSLRNIITRAIGHNKEVIADHFSLSLKDQDLFLLCSDGLNTMLQDQEINFILNNFPPEQAIEELINCANNKGGEDNITAILVQT